MKPRSGIVRSGRQSKLEREYQIIERSVINPPYLRQSTRVEERISPTSKIPRSTASNGPGCQGFAYGSHDPKLDSLLSRSSVRFFPSDPAPLTLGERICTRGMKS